MRKNVKWSKSVKITTLIFVPILVITAIWMFILFLDQSYSWAERICCASIFIVLLATLFVVFAISPRSIALTESQFILNKGIGTMKLNYPDITNVEIYKSDGIFDVRVFGIGGVCGFTGKFYNNKIGKYTSYVGDYSQALYIQTRKGKKYVLSCEDRDEVYQCLKERIGNGMNTITK